ncbi:hypothetical protein HHK36_000338 [Tetracentron sinense]|uniref:Myeloid leukemia factor n=1 Tax=Tetracentron sinense TaxID=13715 RepID=A0A834ZRE8_TETSI|nr:hypothetical protein HHK36_000338 [Tetracentron sinense]
MQGGRGGRDDFSNFGDPFAGFGGFGGFGGNRSIVSSVFGGRDPFDDPFFARPFGSSMFGSSMFGPSMFGPSMFGSSMFGPSGSPFGGMPASGFLEHQAPQSNQSRGPVIEELNSDEEEEEKDKGTKDKKDNPRKHSRSSREPYVEDPDDETEEKKSKLMQYRNDYNGSDMLYRSDCNRADRTQPQAHGFSFQSSTVTYGGANGAYYTSSTTKRKGSDGVMMEESKEADTITGQAKHRVSRGIHDKGHSLMRKLNPDGRVDTMQALHNLNEDELAGFEESWTGKARKNLPGYNEGFNVHNNIEASSRGQNGQPTRGGWALPSTDRSQNPEAMGSNNGARPSSSKGKAKAVTRINID